MSHSNTMKNYWSQPEAYGPESYWTDKGFEKLQYAYTKGMLFIATLDGMDRIVRFQGGWGWTYKADGRITDLKMDMEDAAGNKKSVHKTDLMRPACLPLAVLKFYTSDRNALKLKS